MPTAALAVNNPSFRDCRCKETFIVFANYFISAICKLNGLSRLSLGIYWI